MKNGDSSEKQVFHCELCDKWFCERHIKPKFPFFIDWDTIFDVQGNRELKLRFYTEYRLEDGHPDFIYWRRTIEEFEIEKNLQNKLIEQALDKMVRSNKSRKKFSIKKKFAIRKPVEKEAEEVHRIMKEAGLTSPAMKLDFTEMKKKSESQSTSVRRETTTTENKHGYKFRVPLEVYSDTEYREKLNIATTMHEVELIVSDYYKKHYIRGEMEKPKKKHWWQCR